MSERLIKQHYRLHTWCGIVLGLFLFLLCFSGALAVYKDDLSRWSERTAASRSGDCRIGVDAAFSSLRERAGSAEIRRLSLPEGGEGYYLLRLKDGSRIALDRCGEETSAGAALLADFFVNLHTRLFFGHEGRWLVGAAGLGMLASLVSGLLFYRKLWRAFFTQRWSRSLRLALSDLHKTVAVWALPFHLLITLTGIWLGLYGLIIPAAQFIRAPEAPATEMRMEGRRPASPSPAQESPPALGALLERAQTAVPGLQPLFVDFKEGIIEVRGNLPGHLVQRHRAGVDFEGGSGAPLMVHDPRRQALPGRLHDMMMPLHFGDWGGDVLKAVYLLLGIAGAALALSGVAVWAEKRVRHAGLFGGPALWPGRLLAGVGGGGAVAVLAMPLVAKVDAVAGFEGDLGIYFALLWGMFCAGLASSSAAAWRRVVVLSLFVCVATVAAGLLFNRGFSGVEGGYAVAAAAALLARTRFGLKGPRAAEVPRGAAV